MNNNYKPLIPNKTIKFIKKEKKTYTDDKKIGELFRNIREDKYQSWLNSPLQEKNVYLSFGKYKNKGSYIYNDDDNIVTKKDYINRFIYNLEKNIDKNGYTINNDKLFRDTIASYIYRLSK